MHLSSTDNAATDVATTVSPATRARRRQRVMLDAAAGALAGAVSRVIVGPLDVIKIRFQVRH
jgi:Mitochondrial carrier protein